MKILVLFKDDLPEKRKNSTLYSHPCALASLSDVYLFVKRKGFFVPQSVKRIIIQQVCFDSGVITELAYLTSLSAKRCFTA